MPMTALGSPAAVDWRIADGLVYLPLRKVNPEFGREVQRPTSLNRLDIPSCQADCLPSKSGGSWGFETGTLFCR